MGLQMFFLIVGLTSSFFAYFIVLNSTDNPFLAVIAMGIVLAFWIGTLTVSIKGKF